MKKPELESRVQTFYIAKHSNTTASSKHQDQHEAVGQADSNTREEVYMLRDI